MRNIKIFLIFALALLLIFHSTPLLARIVTLSGPHGLLRIVHREMLKYHKSKGCYPESKEEFESFVQATKGHISCSHTDDYTYRIITATDNYYHVVTENTKGLRNYEITSDFPVPIYIFKDANEREKLKDKALKEFKRANSIKRRTIVWEFVNFRDKDIKIYLLINVISNEKEDRDVRTYASAVLSNMINNSDRYLVLELINTLGSLPSGLGYTVLKLQIIQMLYMFKDPSALLVLRKLATTEKNINVHPVKTALEVTIKEIEGIPNEGFPAWGPGLSGSIKMNKNRTHNNSIQRT